MKAKKLTPIQELVFKTLIYKPEAIRTVLSSMYQPKRGLKLMRTLLTDRVGIEIDMQGISNKAVEDIKKFNKRHDRGVSVDFDGLARYDQSTPITNLVEFKISFTSLNQLKTLKKVCEILKNDTIASLPHRMQGGLHIHTNLPPVESESVTRIIFFDRLERIQNFIVGTVFKKRKRKLEDFYGNGQVSIYRNKNTIEWRAGRPTFDYHEVAKMVLCCSYACGRLRLNRPVNKALVTAICQL